MKCHRARNLLVGDQTLFAVGGEKGLVTICKYKWVCNGEGKREYMIQWIISGWVIILFASSVVIIHKWDWTVLHSHAACCFSHQSDNTCGPSIKLSFTHFSYKFETKSMYMIHWMSLGCFHRVTMASVVSYCLVLHVHAQQNNCTSYKPTKCHSLADWGNGQHEGEGKSGDSEQVFLFVSCQKTNRANQITASDWWKIWSITNHS